MKKEIQEALKAGYDLKTVMTMVEAKSSAELEGAKTDKTLLDMLNMV